MDSEKRKRNNGSIEGGARRSKAPREDHDHDHDDDAATTSCTAGASDAEVEEFFAILRRVHSAVNYFQKENGKLTQKGGSAKHAPPGFKWRDLDETNGNGVKIREKREEEAVVEENNIFLDLNAHPS